MAKQLQLRGGTTAEHAGFTGAPREVTVDTDRMSLVVHDGVTPGGIDVPNQADVDIAEQNANEQAGENDNLQNEVNFNAYGLTQWQADEEERFLETEVPNAIVDKVSDAVRFSDGLYGRGGGDELVVNGTFDTDSDWTLSSNMVIEDGVLKFNSPASGVSASQAFETVIGKTYMLNIEVLASGGTYHRIYINDVLVDATNITGKKTFIHKAIKTNGSIRISNYGVAYSAFDNISVKEISEYTLPDVPFADNSVLHDDSLNGLNLVQSVSKGDFVVTGNELVTNGTFDSDVSGWTAGTNSIISRDTTIFASGGLKIVNSSTSLGYAYQGFPTETGQEYILSFIGDTSSAGIRIDLGGGAPGTSTGQEYGVQGQNTFTFTATHTITYIALVVNSNVASKFVVFDNVSVKLKDTRYQAIQDAPSGTALTDTNYFKVQPVVARQDVMTIRKHKTTKAVDTYTFKGLNFYGEDYHPNDVMSDYGFSKIGTGLWEDADYEHCFVGLVDRLA